MYFCSVTGSVLVVGGLYMLLWGKSKETQMKQNEVSSKDFVQCEAIHVTNRSLACSQKDQEKKIVASAPSYTPSTVNHS